MSLLVVRNLGLWLVYGKEDEIYFDTLKEIGKKMQVERAGTRSRGHRIKSSHDSGRN